jgi:hypothetical protein
MMVGEVKEGSELDGKSLHHLRASTTLMLPAQRDIRVLGSNYTNDAVHKWAQAKATVSLICTKKVYRGSGATLPVSLNLYTFMAWPHYQ